MYKAEFSNRQGTVVTEVAGAVEGLSGYCFPMLVDGVLVETDGFEELTIDCPEQYSKAQLALFDYTTCYPYKDKDRPLLVLKDYRLEVCVPVAVQKVGSEDRTEELLHVVMEHDGKRVQRTCSLLGAHSQTYDMLEALVELQELLKGAYCMATCSSCMHSFWNPYGGNEFYNHLCFKAEAEAFRQIGDKSKQAVLQFMKYGEAANFQLVRLTDVCGKFEPR